MEEGLGGVSVTSLGMEETRDSVHNDRSSWWNDSRGGVGNTGEVVDVPALSVDVRPSGWALDVVSTMEGGSVKASSA